MNIEIVTVKLNLIGNYTINLSNVYKPPNKRLIEEDIQAILNSYGKLLQQVIELQEHRAGMPKSKF